MDTYQSMLNPARKDKFLMVFDLPPILKPLNSSHNNDETKLVRDSVQFSIFGTMIPGITVKANDVRFAGSGLYLSSHTKDSNPPITVKFKVDSNYTNYWTVYSWLNLLHDQEDGVYNAMCLNPSDSNFDDYRTDFTVYGLGEGGMSDKRIKFTYKKAFPTGVDALEYDQQIEGETELICGFTFVYSQLHVQLL